MYLIVIASLIVCVSVNRIVAASRNNLSCYQCVVNDNTLCDGEEDLLKCPEDQAYDRCITIILKNANEGFLIKKKCVLGPCEEESQAINKGLSLFNQCDRDKDEFYCSHCCQGNGCNKDAATAVQPPLRCVWMTVFLLAALIMQRSTHLA